MTLLTRTIIKGLRNGPSPRARRSSLRGIGLCSLPEQCDRLSDGSTCFLPGELHKLLRLRDKWVVSVV